ncbi:MAG: VOC family protein [Actinomycetota bacterium]
MSLVTIGAHDLQSLRRFYAALGWKESPGSQPGWAAFQTGGAILSLFPFEELAADAEIPPPVRRESFRGVTLAVNVDHPADVDAAITDARRAGGQILKEPCDAEWGGRSAYFADPEGNVWEVAWLPGSSFDERGALILP